MIRIKDYSFIDGRTILCHSKNYEFIKQKLECTSNDMQYIFTHKIIVDDSIPEYTEKWIPPYDRFIEYEPKDEEWAKRLGIGTIKKEPVFYLM